MRNACESTSWPATAVCDPLKNVMHDVIHDVLHDVITVFSAISNTPFQNWFHYYESNSGRFVRTNGWQLTVYTARHQAGHQRPDSCRPLPDIDGRTHAGHHRTSTAGHQAITDHRTSSTATELRTITSHPSMQTISANACPSRDNIVCFQYSYCMKSGVHTWPCSDSLTVYGKMLRNKFWKVRICMRMRAHLHCTRGCMHSLLECLYTRRLILRFMT